MIFETGQMIFQRYGYSGRTREMDFIGLCLRFKMLLVREIHASWTKCTPDARWLRGEEHDRRKRLRLKTSLAPSDSISQTSIDSDGDGWRERVRGDLLYDEEWRQEMGKWVDDVEDAYRKEGDGPNSALHNGGSMCEEDLLCGQRLGAGPSGVDV